MTVREFFDVFEDIGFYYECEGVQGGTPSEHVVTFSLFGYAGPHSNYSDTFNFQIINNDLDFSNYELKKYTHLDGIDKDIMDMEIIKIVSINLGGNNRTSMNYFNDSSDITIMVKARKK